MLFSGALHVKMGLVSAVVKQTGNHLRVWRFLESHPFGLIAEPGRIQVDEESSSLYRIEIKSIISDFDISRSKKGAIHLGTPASLRDPSKVQNPSIPRRLVLTERVLC